MNYGTHDYDHDPKPVFLGTACMTNWASPLCFAIKQTALLALGLASGHQKLCGASKYGERLAIEPAAPRADGGRIRGAYYRRLGVDAGARVVGPAARAGGGEGAGGAEHRGARDRSHTGCRLHYLEKLSYQKVWLPHGLRPPRTHTVIIFDWDDTLLCTSAINGQEWTRQQLRQLERAVESILQTSMLLGETLIVTNGVETWVESSASRYLPGLLPTLRRLTVVSARARHEAAHPGDPVTWKCKCFREILAQRRLDRGASPRCGGGGDVNLVVLGDSPAEIEAARRARPVIGAASLVKTVKFRESPSAAELLGQLRRVVQDLRQIVEDGHNMKRSLVQRAVPSHLDHLAAWASGWRLSEKKAQNNPCALALPAFWPLFP